SLRRDRGRVLVGAVEPRQRAVESDRLRIRAWRRALHRVERDLLAGGGAPGRVARPGSSGAVYRVYLASRTEARQTPAERRRQEFAQEPERRVHLGRGIVGVSARAERG